MKSVKILPFLALALLLLLAACTSASGSDSAKDEERYSITLNVLPDPPIVGDVLLYFTVLDAQGKPVTDAKVKVSADHTDMSGMGMQGDATDQGKGVYAVTTNFSMTGQWKISVELSHGTTELTQDFDLIIQ